jgi:hypothetical protein
MPPCYGVARRAMTEVLDPECYEHFGADLATRACRNTV